MVSSFLLPQLAASRGARRRIFLRLPMSTRSSSRSPSPSGRERLSQPFLNTAVLNGSVMTASAAFAPIRTAESRVPWEVLHKPHPAPHDYEPMLMPSGNEWSMQSLNGSELNPSAAFAPIQTAEARVPWEVRHKQFPAPHDYCPLLMPNGNEWSMNALNGSEKSAAFAPIQTAEPRVPREMRHRTSPGPDLYRPMTTCSGGRLLSISPSPETALSPSRAALFTSREPKQAFPKTVERLRGRKLAPLLTATSTMRPPQRSNSPAKWSDRVPAALMQSPSLSRSRSSHGLTTHSFGHIRPDEPSWFWHSPSPSPMRARTPAEILQQSPSRSVSRRLGFGSP